MHLRDETVPEKGEKALGGSLKFEGMKGSGDQGIGGPGDFSTCIRPLATRFSIIHRRARSIG